MPRSHETREAASLPLLSYCGWLLVFAVAAQPGFAAPPQLTSLSPRGLKAGANDVIVQGAGFSDATRLLLDPPGAVVALKADVPPTANQVHYVVTLPAETAPGVYEARVAGVEGVSNPQVWMLDQFANVAEVEPNNSLPQAQAVTLPAALEGRLTGVESDLIAFDGKQGQRFVAEIAGRRLGANVRPVLRLFDSRRLELAVARGTRQLGGDARLIATLPADGRYFLELHDLVYRGDNNQYRLLLGDVQAAELAFPLGGRRGTTVPVALLGGTQVAGAAMPVVLNAPATVDLLGFPLPAGITASALPLALAVGEYDEILEAPTADGKPQAVGFPSVANGRIMSPGERDRYQFAVTPGSRLRCFVQAEQFGSPLDAVVQILNEQGGVLATQDDAPGSADPDFLFVVPAGVTQLVASVSDAHGRSGERLAYRLVLEPAPLGDFQLILVDGLVNVPAGGSAAVRVRAVRRDFNDAIRLKLVGAVPAGVKLSGAEIGPGATDTWLSLTAPPETPVSASLLQIVGEAGPAEAPGLIRGARLAGQPYHDGLPWLRTRLAGGMARAGLFALDIETPEPAILRGVEYVAKVKVRRNPGETGPINLAVRTSELPPGQVLLAPVANLTIAENASEGVIRIGVPGNVPELPVTFVVSGQLLDAKEKKTVVGTAEAPAVATKVAFPFAVQLAAVPELQRGVRHLLPGKLQRLGSFNEPIQVAVSGLPGTVRSVTVTVPAGATEFQIPLLASPAQAAGPVPSLKFAGTWATNPPLASNPADVPLTFSAADPPAALEIYEDGSDFIAGLVEGAGMAAAETTDVYSGKESVAVKPDQKFRSVLPGLTVAIAEAPAAGQYRYLRYAWKKKGGTGVMLQLANNGQFGTVGGKGTDFRYVAGQDLSNTKAIRLAEQPPAEWTVVTRDLFADHGPFTLTGIALTVMDGDAGLFDHIYLARTEADFPPPPKKVAVHTLNLSGPPGVVNAGMQPVPPIPVELLEPDAACCPGGDFGRYPAIRAAVAGPPAEGLSAYRTGQAELHQHLPPAVQRPAPRQTPTAQALVGSQEGRAARSRTPTTLPGAARADQAGHPRDALGVPQVRASPSRRRGEIKLWDMSAANREDK